MADYEFVKVTKGRFNPRQTATPSAELAERNRRGVAKRQELLREIASLNGFTNTHGQPSPYNLVTRLIRSYQNGEKQFVVKLK